MIYQLFTNNHAGFPADDSDTAPLLATERQPQSSPGNDNLKHASCVCAFDRLTRTKIGFRPTAFPFEGFFWVMFSKDLFKTDIIGLVENPLRFFLHPREDSVHHIMVSVCRTVVLTSSRRPCAVWHETTRWHLVLPSSSAETAIVGAVLDTWHLQK